MAWHPGFAVQVQGKGTAVIGSFCGFKLLDKAERSRRTAIHQAPANSLCEPTLQVGNLLRRKWEGKDLDCFDIRGEQIERAIHHHQAWTAKNRKIFCDLRIASCKL